MKRLSKRILSLILCCVLMLPSIGMLQGVSAESIRLGEIGYPRSKTWLGYEIPTSDPNYNGNNRYGYNQPLTFMDGTTIKAMNGFELFVKDWDTATGNVVYCIEPGVRIYTSDYSNVDVSYITDDFWNTSRSSVVLNRLTAAQARQLLGQILKEAYHGSVSVWDDFNNNEQRKAIMKAYAAQILVWEVVTGERDAQFRHLEPPAGFNYNVQTDRISPNMPSEFWDNYNAIVNAVQNPISNSIPSFASNSLESAPTYTMNFSNDTYSLTLNNSNGAIGDDVRFTFSEPGVRIQKNGNKITLTADDNMEGTVTVTVSGKCSAYEPRVYTDNFSGGNQNQDVIYAIDGESQTFDINGYFKLKFPHIHRYIPFFTDPDCIHRGYITWVCRCGDSYVNNYKDPLGHNFCPVKRIEPDCITQGRVEYRCSRCGAEYIEALEPTGHTDPLWVISRRPTCTQDGEQVGLCTTCGKVIDSRPIPATGHGTPVWKIDFEATPEHDGQMTQYCSVCGEAVGEKRTFPMHTHTEGYTSVLLAAECEKAGELGVFCETCGACYETREIAPLGHGDTVAVTSTPATCTTDGESTLYCTRCGLATGTQTVPAHGHIDGAWYESVAATCTAEGEEILACACCGETIDSRVTDALGHDDGVWQTTVPASCTTVGEECLFCTRCGYVEDSRSIPMTEHDEGVWTVSVKPTCTVDGEEICRCTACGEKIDARVIPATGHDKGVWLIDFEATPEHDGQMSLYCSKCHQVMDTKTFEVHKHTPGYKEMLASPTCTTEGEGALQCARCGARYYTYAIEALGHDYSDWAMNNDGTHSRSCSRCHDQQTENCSIHDSIMSPTCTEGGYTQHMCTACGYRYRDTLVEPLGHDWSAWSALESGQPVTQHAHHCARCGEREKEEHSWSDWTSDRNGSFFRNGTKSRVCTLCGAKQIDEEAHSSILGKIFYPIVLFLSNILNKTLYGVSLRWLFPWLNLPRK